MNKEHPSSPSIIANAILPQELSIYISPTTLYSYIHHNRPQLKRKLRFKNWYSKSGSMYRKKVKLLPNYTERPEEADNRSEIWHRELDSVVSKWHIWWITTLTERLTRYLIIRRSDRLQAEKALYNIIYMLEWQDPKSITTDNWTEFSLLHIYSSKYNVPCYLCDPYSSWQKWSNERNNREIRVFFPKWTIFDKYTSEKIQEVQDKINKKPRKILGWKSAYELYHWVEINYLTWEIIPKKYNIVNHVWL